MTIDEAIMIIKAYRERLTDSVSTLLDGDIEAFDMAVEAMERESCDTISRQAAVDAVKKNTLRLTFAEEQGCKGHVAWSAEAVYSDVIEGALLELPSVTPQPKIGHWIKDDITERSKREYKHKCDRCGAYHRAMYDYCPSCGAKMVDPQERSDKE